MSNKTYRAITQENYERFKSKFKENVIDEIIKIEQLIPGTFVDASMNPAGDRLILTRMDETTLEIPIDGGAGNIEVGDVTEVAAVPKHGRVLLTWTDPGNVVVEGATLARWAGTLVVRKAGSAPQSKTDGTVVVDNTTRNAYASTAFVDTGLTDGTKYYYRFFPYTTGLAYTPGTTIDTTPDREVVAIPTASGQLTYTGSYQTQEINNYDDTKMTRTGDTGGTDAGTYITTFTLDEDYKWSDGTITAKNVTWTIERQAIANTPSQTGALTYDGTEQEPAWQDYDNTKMTIDGTTAGTNAGSYTVTFTPGSNYKWSNGAITAREVTWTIGRQAVVATPVQSGTLTYNTTEQTPVWTGYDNTKMTISGDTAGTNAGNYTATFTLGSNYKWPNGNTTPLDVTWSIAKTTGNVTLSEESISLDTNTLTATFTVTRSGDGAISVTVDDDTIATATLSGSTVTVEAVATGNAIVTVSVAAGTNYEAVTKDIAVAVQFVKPLNDCTWAEISAIAQAGKGDLYWDVGDCKEITLNGKIGDYFTANNLKLCVFILDFNHKDNNIEDNNIIFGGFKTALSGGVEIALRGENNGNNFYDGSKHFNMNHRGTTSGNPGTAGYYGTNFGGWKGSDFRYDILGATSTPPSQYNQNKTAGNVGYDATLATITTPVADTFLAALPSDLRGVLRLWDKWEDAIGGWYSSDDRCFVKTTDAVSILTVVEAYGRTINNNQYAKNYQTQMKYYSDGNSHAKHTDQVISDPTATGYLNWWLSSPVATSQYQFQHDCPWGGADYTYASMSMGLAPAFKV